MIYKASPIFDHVYPIIIKVASSFPKFVSACKKSAHFIDSFLRYSRFWSLKATTIFDHQHPKIMKEILASLNLY